MAMQWIKRLMESPRLLIWLGIFVFAYSWIASLVLQLLIIPILFSNAGAAEGLVVLDSTGFHEHAKAKAAEISSFGWSAWELRPHGQSPVGIASVFYVIFGSAPISMLPFNAAVHALSACLVMTILRNFFSAIPTLIGSLAFALNPAAFEWVSQIHRDGVFILGNLLLFMGILRFINEAGETDNKSLKRWAGVLLPPIVGTLLIWVARMYWVQVALVTVLVIAALFMIAVIFRKNAVDRRRVVRGMVMLVGLGLFQQWLIYFHIPHIPINPDDLDNASYVINVHKSLGNAGETSLKTYYTIVDNATRQVDALIKENPKLTLELQKDHDLRRRMIEEEIVVALRRAGIAGLTSGNVTSSYQKNFVLKWNRSDWLPEAFDQRFFRLAHARWGVINSGGQSLVDESYALDSAKAIIEYLPRALQLGLLSPMPEFWGGQGSTPAMTVGRKVMGVATLVLFYPCLLGLVVGIYQMRNRLQLWIVFSMCFIGILFYAVVYPNVGALVRFRYGFYMLLVGYGAAFWVHLWMKRQRRSIGI